MKHPVSIISLIVTVLLTLSVSCVQARTTGVCARMESFGLVDVSLMDTSLVVDLIYAGPQNFVGKTMYPPELTKAYLHPEAAKALVKASKALHSVRPDLRFKITDAARPMSVQRTMYNVVKGTPQAPYVSNPANGGGLHNYGLAVDITLVDASGRELPMGTVVDHLGPEANIDREDYLVAQGIITAAERENRLILRRAMQAGGFKPLRSEWWHFNLRSRPEARKSYKVLDF